MSRPSGCTDSTDGRHTYCIFTSPSRLRAESFWDGFCGRPIRSMWLSIWVESHPSLACSNTVVNVASSLYPRGNLLEIDLDMPIRQLKRQFYFLAQGDPHSLSRRQVALLGCTILVLSYRLVVMAHALPKRATTSAHALNSKTHNIKVYKKAYRYGTLYPCVRRRNTII